VAASERMGLVDSIIGRREDQTYTSCYCEENVWCLCKRLCAAAAADNPDHLLDSSFAVFISNENRTVPLWRQKAARHADKPVVWDYHVILIVKAMPASDGDASSPSQVFDLDTTLPYPCDFGKYASATFPFDDQMPAEYKRMFRVISAKEFLQHFASDRRHMKKSSAADENEGGGVSEWLQPPPTYDCIVTPQSVHNLDLFISMDKSVGWGRVMDLGSLHREFI